VLAAHSFFPRSITSCSSSSTNAGPALTGVNPYPIGIGLSFNRQTYEMAQIEGVELVACKMTVDMMEIDERELIP
jgi:hypothetical protein